MDAQQATRKECFQLAWLLLKFGKFRAAWLTFRVAFK
jgi:hypothetical protein